MNRLLMMGLILLGAFMMSLRSAPAAPAKLPACKDCTCKVVQYWRDYSNKATYGERVPNKDMPGTTLPVSHALGSNSGIAFYTTACDAGSLTQTGVTCYRYTYDGTWTAVCAVPDPPGAGTRAEATVNNPDDYTPAGGFGSEDQYTCKE